jgi:DNA-binding MarR family transcriptional regulator
VPDRPAPPRPSAAFLIMGLGRLVRDDVDAALGAHGLSTRHLSALGHLSGEPGLSYSELGRRAGVTAQSMQATLRQLEDRGAVERRTTPGRGRTAELHVTPAGAELLALGRRVLEEADERLLAGVPAERRAELAEVLLAAFSRRAAPPGPPA